MGVRASVFVPASSNQAAKFSDGALISPIVDASLIGGASIVFLLLFWLFVLPSASTFTISWVVFALAFAVNSPHFLSSYQLMYGDYRKEILVNKRFFWAGIIAPLLILAGLVYGITQLNVQVLGFMAQTMYLSVGWHYVKQIYGISLVASAVQRRYFTNWQKTFLLLNLYSVWAVSWLGTNTKGGRSELNGLAFMNLDLPPQLLNATFFILALTLIALLYLSVRHYLKTGSRPAVSSIICFLTIYAWYMPVLAHPSFFYVIPFFHSLQYLFFVLAMKKNQAQIESSAVKDPVGSRSLFLRKFWGFWVLTVILGALAFEFVPKFLDQNVALNQQVLGKEIWMFSFVIFINLHHYFIDNVIWRGDNEFLKKYLVGPSQAASGTAAQR